LFGFLLDPALRRFDFTGPPTDTQIACFWATILNFAPLIILILLFFLALSLVVPVFWAIVALMVALIFNFVAMLYTIANQIELGFINNAGIANNNPSAADLGYGVPEDPFSKVKVV
jgi:hypothetical protein